MAGAQRLVLGDAGIWERVTTIGVQFRGEAKSRAMQRSGPWGQLGTSPRSFFLPRDAQEHYIPATNCAPIEDAVMEVTDQL